MSLAIRMENISEILLPDGKWYVIDGGIIIDAYEYGFTDSDYNNKWFVQYQPSNPDNSIGFKASVKGYKHNGVEKTEIICGSMSNIVAIKFKNDKKILEKKDE